MDEETMHYEEEIGYLMFQQPGLIYGNNLSKDKKLINKEITEINTEKNKESLSSAEMASVIAGITLTKNGEIRLDYDIKIGRYEVTYKEYIGFLNAVEVTTERYNKGYYLGKEIVDLEDVDAIVVDGKQFYFVGSDKVPIEDCPVSYVSWYGAVAYANWLSEKEGLTPAYNLDNWQLKGAPESLEGYRLPTEVEWEYAARGGAGGKITDYAGSNNLDEVGWYNDNSNQRLHPVGQKMPNELGIYDLSGNVSEWTNDEAGGEIRITRGGNYGSTYPYCRVNRDSVGAAHAYFSSVSTGFRLVKTK